MVWKHERDIEGDYSAQLLPSCPALLLVLELDADERDLHNLLVSLVTGTLKLH